MDIEKLVVPEGCRDLTLREGNAPSPLPLYNYQGFQYAAETTASFVELVKAKGDRENAVVFANASGFFAILDDRVRDREHDTVSRGFGYSVQAKEWLEVIQGRGKAFSIKGIVDFLKRRDEREIEDISELLYSMQNFKYVSNTSGDFTFDSMNNYTFAIRVSEVEGTVRIPQMIYAAIELYEGSNWPQVMEIEVEIQKPKEAGEGPVVFLSCPKFDRYLKDAKENESNEMKRQLDGWLVVSGSNRS